MKVHRIELLIVDHDDVGEEEIVDLIENSHYPNHCIAPSVMSFQTREIEWDDDHPLNMLSTQDRTFRSLFGC